MVLAWNGARFLGPCLSSVFRQATDDVEVLVVDNGSSDGSADLVVERFPAARCIRLEDNVGYAAGNNVGLREARGSHLVLLNQDTVVAEDWLARLREGLAQERVGLVGCKITYPDGRLQHAGGRSDRRGHVAHVGRGEPDSGQYDEARDVELVTAAAVGLTRPALQRIGYLDEGFSHAYYEDCDWCYRARDEKLRVLYWPWARLVHHESSSTSGLPREALDSWLHHGRLRMLLKHRALRWLEEVFEPLESAWLRSLVDAGVTSIIRAAYDEVDCKVAGLCIVPLQQAMGGRASRRDSREDRRPPLPTEKRSTASRLKTAISMKLQGGTEPRALSSSRLGRSGACG